MAMERSRQGRPHRGVARVTTGPREQALACPQQWPRKWTVCGWKGPNERVLYLCQELAVATPAVMGEPGGQGRSLGWRTFPDRPGPPGLHPLRVRTQCAQSGT